MLQIGLVSPDLDMTVKFDKISNEVAEQIVNPFKTLFEAGQKLAQQNRTTARILFYVLSGFVYSAWASMIGLCLQLIRFGISKLRGYWYE